ncbi:hypothetical protein NAEGRDRAFT_79503 [Naegleria gruberi]|uniref:Uncharacterized protein n=1 Tax=Naegleria gruberi TaxID=5762 RepID=D2VDI7_NAEGR|nr:uncharacterized protein NAEGRDRAFT_79503 [Naegleria gruberi]EFC45241.1 hypothetical protein NAEGRDRAFT_79503 [Naegleria gruberi]|eukprot:XP_002677985.1 hypothetical protein NAEGRDRAFT_79503 [Naegleria gruberi strain NEG-M]
MSTQLHLFVKELPASEEDPAKIFIKSLNSTSSEFELVFEDSTGEVDKELVLDLPLPSIARAHKIELKLVLPEVGFEKVFTFNLTDDGVYVLLDGTEGLKYKQQKTSF